MRNSQISRLIQQVRPRSARACRRHSRIEELECAMLSTAAVAASFAQIPMSFEANVGQTAAQVQYLARGAGYTVFLTPNEAVVSLESTAASAQGSSGAVVQMQWEGANAASPLVAQDPLQYTSNYLIALTSDWHTNVPNFGQVERLGRLSRGEPYLPWQSALVGRGVHDRARYVSGVIRLAMQGRVDQRLDAQGDLVLHGRRYDPGRAGPSALPGVRRRCRGRRGQPRCWGRTVKVGFAVGTYDPSQPLVIDHPVRTPPFWAATAMTRAMRSPWTRTECLYHRIHRFGQLPGNRRWHLRDAQQQNIFVSKQCRRYSWSTRPTLASTAALKPTGSPWTPAGDLPSRVSPLRGQLRPPPALPDGAGR